jgi:hypothetical protein
VVRQPVEDRRRDELVAVPTWARRDTAKSKDESVALLVVLAGVGVAGIGLLGVAAPRRLSGLLARWRVLTAFQVTVALRLGFGALFVVAAPSCRFPGFVRLIGVLELVGAVTLAVSGAARLQRFVDWWLARPPSFVRVWCLVALGFGVSLACAGGSG